MSPLALAIYKQLRKQLLADVTSITYGRLAELVGSKERAIHPRSPALHASLTEVSLACRAADLPCIPAMVWRAGLARPSDGYYAVAHPRQRTEKSRVAAWRREHEAVVAAAGRYPNVLAAPEQ